METKITVALCSDLRFCYFAAASIASVLANAAPSDSFVFHVLTEGYPEEDKAILRRLAADRGARIVIHDIRPEHVAAIPDPCARYPKSAFFRLFLAEYIEDADRVLYLDVDTITLTSLEPLFRTDLAGKVFAAAIDKGQGPGWPERKARELGVADRYSPGLPYFNSGVMLIDLHKWREQRVLERGLAIAADKSVRIDCADQDILNILYVADYVVLERAWNVKNLDVNDVENPYIFHCTGDFSNKFSVKYVDFFLRYIFLTAYRVFPLSYVYSCQNAFPVPPLLADILAKYTEKLKESLEDRSCSTQCPGKGMLLKRYADVFKKAYKEYCVLRTHGRKVYFVGSVKLYESTKKFFAGIEPQRMLAAHTPHKPDMPVLDFCMIPQELLRKNMIVVFMRHQDCKRVFSLLKQYGISYDNVLFSYPFALFA